jgi:membrane protein DedA with SNARE-associated domain
MDALAIGGLALLLLVKESGVPIPVPGDLLVIGAGVALAGDPPLAVSVLMLILVVGYVGGSIQFLLARRLRGPLLSALDRVGVGEARVESLASRLRRSGARGVALARLTPGVRIAAIVAAGLAALPYAAFLIGLVIGNGVFVAGHFALGYVVGGSATELINGLGGAGMLAVGAVVAAAGGIGFAILRHARVGSGETETVGDWTDAACPACLAVAIARFEMKPRTVAD